MIFITPTAPDTAPDVPLVEPPKTEPARKGSGKPATLLPETKVDITPVPPKKPAQP
jgi:hypothetical protein